MGKPPESCRLFPVHLSFQDPKTTDRWKTKFARDKKSLSFRLSLDEQKIFYLEFLASLSFTDETFTNSRHVRVPFSLSKVTADRAKEQQGPRSSHRHHRHRHRGAKVLVYRSLSERAPEWVGARVRARWARWRREQNICTCSILSKYRDARGL